MKARRRVQLAVLAAIGVAAGLLQLQPAGAAGKQAAHEPIRTTIEVVAGGLNTPRGLVYDREHHRVLVAEAGVGAVDRTGPCGAGEGGTMLCLGLTGSIFQWTEDGSKRIVTHLPSISTTSGSTVLGLHDLSLYRDRLTAVFGLLGTPATRAALGPAGALLGQAARVSESGHLTPIADVAALENKLNPGDESDPYGVATGRYGTVIANAGGHAFNAAGFGGNDILLVNRKGKLSQLAQFPQRVPAANPNDIVESVPTTVEQGPDGAFYVGELTGFPYYVGEARVWRVVPGHQPTIFAQGFTNVVDITFDEQGRLIVLEIAKNNLLAADQTGALIRVEHNGQQTLLASTGMTNPGGVVSAGDGVFYVTNNSASPAGTGQLLRVRVHEED